MTRYTLPELADLAGMTLELDDEPLDFEEIGAIALKAVREPVALYRALIRHSSAES